ncbi:MAG: C40 family peptidase [Chitinophagales bacterium]|nr:C40 family peptidase [Chitinophagales bacterium]
MNIGIVSLAAVPMRKEPSDRAEMVNQILFGETFDVLEEQEKWTLVQLHHDSYQGWIDRKQWDYASGIADVRNCNTALFEVIPENGRDRILPMGALSSEYFPAETDPLHSLVDTARLFLDTPYLWGGRNFMGIDCSGFTQVVFRARGKYILRDAYQQAEQGERVELGDAANGDLAFFANSSGRMIHVGILMVEDGETRIIHASGKVRIDRLDKEGIYNEDTASYSHQLHHLQRI